MSTFDIKAADLHIYMFPGACSRVTMTALEEAGLSYGDTLINIMSMQQKSADYLAVNPKAKVPALRINGAVLTENAAILTLLDRCCPQARLLPHDADPVRDTRGLSDMLWCSSTLHILVRQIRNPGRLSTGDTDGVRADGMAKFAHECETIATRFADGPWWYGAEWSILDAYINWVYTGAAKSNFDLTPYPAILAHGERHAARPSAQRVLARETAAIARHKAELPPGFAA